ncbi:MAG: hypothetical protein KIT09_22285 [Bryobacteraceae bacterium]|nr:hypothetical protein [Bryobacteraceae bacterium]
MTAMEQIMHHVTDPDRIRANTWAPVNEWLDRKAELRLRQHAWQNGGITRRIEELGREWDFERVLQAEASAMGLLGLALSLAVRPAFLVLPGMATAMVLLHALQGWYPLLPLFRRLGIRSQDEIDRERYAMKSLRGDFDELSGETDAARRAEAAWRAVCA